MSSAELNETIQVLLQIKHTYIIQLQIVFLPDAQTLYRLQINDLIRETIPDIHEKDLLLDSTEEYTWAILYR